MAGNLTNFDFKTREENLKKISNNTFELFIIGGGITGAGVFRDASLQGVTTLLCDANDFAFGTSSRSTKLVHGGIRYLENFEFHLVFESLNERFILNRLAPHLVKPLEFYLPIYDNNAVPSWKIRIGLFLYDLLALFRSTRTHRKIKKSLVGNLLQSGLHSIFSYFDYWTDDARLTLENIMDGHEHGGIALNYVRVTNVKKVNELFEIELNNSIKVFSKKIFNATGPDSDLVRKVIQGTKPGPQLAPTKGVHVVVPKDRLSVNTAFIVNVPQDKRVAFVIPWSKNTIIGTTDTFSSDTQDQLSVTKEDVQYLLSYANHYFPESKLTKEDVVSSWVGLRPLVKPDSSVKAGKVSREEKIWFEPENCLNMIGGKLTTYRKVSRKIMKLLEFTQSKIITKRLPLPGGRNSRYPFGSRFEYIEKIEKEFPHLAKPLSARTYVKKSWVYFSLRHESVVHLSDVMVRRFGIYYRQPTGGMDEAMEVLKLMKEYNQKLDEKSELKQYIDWVNKINSYKAPIDINSFTGIQNVI